MFQPSELKATPDSHMYCMKDVNLFHLDDDCKACFAIISGQAIELEIPAKKWGDTEIAERGRSVLVMRARYRSAGLTPHQRGWTDAG